uniref:Uncharacterized protein n=1 Tax=Lynx canadensis TaxID=61383 RepID=A0A667GTQ8_LYNCA
MSEKKQLVDLGLWEEDNEFREFPKEDWAGLDENEEADTHDISGNPHEKMVTESCFWCKKTGKLDTGTEEKFSFHSILFIYFFLIFF